MDILRREIAPIPSEVWKQLDETVADIARRTLAARRIATFEGPRGWNHVAVTLGTVTPRKTREGQAVVAMPDVVLLAEIRAAFSMPWSAVEAVERGAPALDATAAEAAAREVAHAEDRLAFHGRLKAATAASRATAVLMLVLPPVVLAFYLFRDGDYLDKLTATFWGRATLGAAIALQILGTFFVRRILKNSQRA